MSSSIRLRLTGDAGGLDDVHILPAHAGMQADEEVLVGEIDHVVPAERHVEVFGDGLGQVRRAASGKQFDPAENRHRDFSLPAARAGVPLAAQNGIEQHVFVAAVAVLGLAHHALALVAAALVNLDGAHIAGVHAQVEPVEVEGGERVAQHGFGDVGAVSLVPLGLVADQNAELGAALAPVQVEQAGVADVQPPAPLWNLHRERLLFSRALQHPLVPGAFMVHREAHVAFQVAAHFGVREPLHETRQILALKRPEPDGFSENHSLSSFRDIKCGSNDTAIRRNCNC